MISLGYLILFVIGLYTGGFLILLGNSLFEGCKKGPIGRRIVCGVFGLAIFIAGMVISTINFLALVLTVCKLVGLVG